jgi:hypothetical protein
LNTFSGTRKHNGVESPLRQTDNCLRPENLYLAEKPSFEASHTRLNFRILRAHKPCNSFYRPLERALRPPNQSPTIRGRTGERSLLTWSYSLDHSLYPGEGMIEMNRFGSHADLALAVFLCAAIPLLGQAPLLRSADGKPDLNGIWQALNAAGEDLEDHSGALHAPPGQSVVEGGEGSLPSVRGSIPALKGPARLRPTCSSPSSPVSLSSKGN